MDEYGPSQHSRHGMSAYTVGALAQQIGRSQAALASRVCRRFRDTARTVAYMFPAFTMGLEDRHGDINQVRGPSGNYIAQF